MNTVKISPKDVERFWAKVNKEGPVPEHAKHLGPCWVWTKGKTTAGYGGFYIAKVHHYAHRFSWQIHFGEIEAGLCVCHKCDNPPCCNPQHFFKGTHAQNQADKCAKGRYVHGDGPRGDAHYSRTNPEKLARGDRNGLRMHPEKAARGDANGARKYPERLMRGEKVFGAKLTSEKVREIRKLYAEGMNMEQLGRMFSVQPSNIDFIVKRKTWRHVTDATSPTAR